MDGGDVDGFQVLVDDKRDAALAQHAVPGTDPSYSGIADARAGFLRRRGRLADRRPATQLTGPWKGGTRN